MRCGELRVAVRITFNFRFLIFCILLRLTYLSLFFYLFNFVMLINVMMESWDVRDAYEVACWLRLFWSNGDNGSYVLWGGLVNLGT